MDKPNRHTSNYGWALWHLKRAEEATDTQAALVHVGAAQARATLATLETQPGFSGSTWDDEEQA